MRSSATTSRLQTARRWLASPRSSTRSSQVKPETAKTKTPRREPSRFLVVTVNPLMSSRFASAARRSVSSAAKTRLYWAAHSAVTPSRIVDPTKTVLPVLTATSSSWRNPNEKTHLSVSQSLPRRLWEAIVAAVVAVAASTAPYLLFISDERDIESGRKLFVLATAECDSGPCSSAARPPPEQARWQATSAAAATATSPETGRAASGTGGSASPASSSHPATTNVSFRPRWLDHIFSSGQQHGSGTSAATTGGSDNDDVLLQSTGKPYDVSVRAIRGGRFTMEDEYYVANGGRFVAVFDGHGGAGVAQYLKKQLYPYVTHHLLLKHWEESDEEYGEVGPASVPPGDDESSSLVSISAAGAASEPATGSPTRRHRARPSPQHRPSLSSHVGALRAAFEQVEREVIQDDDCEFQGSTAVAVVLYESEDGHRTLLSANVGDSRAVLSRGGRAVDLTHDHKPNDEKEKARIMALGETIEWDQDCKVHRVRNLSLSRAIGDRYAKPAVSPEVDIQHFPVLENEDEFVVIASDGLWDVMSSQDAVSFVHDHMRKELGSGYSGKESVNNHALVLRRNMAKFLAREAIRKGSSDNVSVLVVWL